MPSVFSFASEDGESATTMRTWSLHVLNHGLVDEHRQRKPSYYVWKDLNTPAVVEAQWDYAQEGAPASFTVTLTPNGLEDLPSYPLRDYRLAWELSYQAGKLLASGEQQLADLSAARTLSGNFGGLPDARIKKLKLRLTLLRPGGMMAAESSLDWDTDAATRTTDVHGKSSEPGTR
ncbi:MAG: hypothetical protein ABSG72_00060 [Candidatus Sulfotelmatobacter sp.]